MECADPHLIGLVAQELHRTSKALVGRLVAFELVSRFICASTPVVEPQRVQRDDRAAGQAASLDRFDLGQLRLD